MVRRVVLACLLLLALVPLTTLAQDEPETGRIYGQVINGTEGGDDITGLEVELTRYQAMDPVETYTATVDDDGSYEFADLPVTEGEAYLARVVYKDIEFGSGMVLLTQDPETERDITVWEQTDDPSVLRIISRGVVIADADQENGVVEILEIIALENDGDRVFTGDEEGTVLRLSIPENASEVSPQPGFDFGQMYFEEGEDTVLVSTGAVTPGSHNPMIGYQIPYEGTSGTLQVGTAMETGTLRVLVEEDTFDISSSVLEPAGTTLVGQDNYNVLHVDRPVVGDSFSVRISGLPRENWNLPIGMSTFFASIAAGVGLAVGAVLIYQVVQRRKLAPAGASGSVEPQDTSEDLSVDELERERLELASELNRLDADFERGDIDEESYQSERDQILDDLRGISLRMRGVEE